MLINTLREINGEIYIIAKRLNYDAGYLKKWGKEIAKLAELNDERNIVEINLIKTNLQDLNDLAKGF